MKLYNESICTTTALSGALCFSACRLTTSRTVPPGFVSRSKTRASSWDLFTMLWPLICESQHISTCYRQIDNTEYQTTHPWQIRNADKRHNKFYTFYYCLYQTDCILYTYAFKYSWCIVYAGWMHVCVAALWNMLFIAVMKLDWRNGPCRLLDHDDDAAVLPLFSVINDNDNENRQ